MKQKMKEERVIVRKKKDQKERLRAVKGAGAKGKMLSANQIQRAKKRLQTLHIIKQKSGGRRQPVTRD